MELRHLRYFTALAEELHFGRAAQRLSISQPALSASISQLEEDLGAVLFDRTHKAVLLTPAGASLLPEAKAILSETKRAEQLAVDASEGRRGWLNVSYSGSMIYAGVPQVVSAYRAAFPDVRTVLTEHRRSEQLDALAHGRIDVGFVDASKLPDEMDGLLVCDDPFIVCLPKAHALANRKTIDLNDLAGEQFMMFSRDIATENFDRIVAICEEAGFEPKIRNAARQWLSLAWVAEGLGVALVPERLGRTGLAGVKFVPLSKPSAIRSHGYLIWNPQRTTPHLRAFVEIAEAEIKRLRGEGNDTPACALKNCGAPP